MVATITNCRFCGKSHGVRCPDVKAIEYAEDGVTVRRVEFVTAADFMASVQSIPLPTGPVTFSQPNAIPFGPANTWGPVHHINGPHWDTQAPIKSKRGL